METIASIAVVVEPSPVIDVKSIGVAGPPGAPGPAGPEGPAGPAGTAGPHQATHAVGGSDPVTGPLALSPYVSVGTNPAHIGAVRLANDQYVTARNPANTADVYLVGLDSGGAMSLAYLAPECVVNPPLITRSTLEVQGASVAIGVNPSQSGSVRLSNTGSITARNAANTADLDVVRTNGSNFTILGNAGQATQIQGSYLELTSQVYFSASAYLSLDERTAPAGPSANRAHLWLEDNGSGKSRLMVQFATGAAIQLAIQP